MKPALVDIHCHILPGIDDGASSLEDALAMAAMASADGIQITIATPHVDHFYLPRPRQELLDRIRDLGQAMRERSIPLQVLPGADVHIADSLPKRVGRGEILTLADTGRYILLEQPHDVYVPMGRLVQELQAVGVRPILSHPERNGAIQSDPEVLWELVGRGCLLQVTAGSLLGEFGPASQRSALVMLDHGLVHFVATDAHSPRHRPPLLSDAWQWLSDHAGPQAASRLCADFPHAVAQGQSISAPDPLPRKKSFFARLFAG